MRESKFTSSLSRRKFLSRAGASTAAAVAARAIGLGWLFNATARSQDSQIFRQPRTVSPQHSSFNKTALAPRISGEERADRSFQIRVEAAQAERNVPIPPHPDNGDETAYPTRIGNFSKGLRHNDRGEVDPVAYNALLAAAQDGTFASYEGLTPYLGCADSGRQNRLVNPLAGDAFDLEGTDCAQLAIPPAPAFSSAQEAGEMVELYWMALLRDVNFDNYAHNPLAQEAAADLSQLSDFRGPKENGQVTTQTLFRDVFPGCTIGPHISQFLLRQTAYGAQSVDQRIHARAPGSDFLTGFADWLDVQNGCIPLNLNIPPATEAPVRFIRNGRDISHYVRLDVLYQAYFVATLVLLNGITLNETTNPFLIRFPFDAGNPYGQNGATGVQAGFGTFGNPHIATLVTEPATRALKAIWFQKWHVHRRLRPEAFGGRVEVIRQHLAAYPIHADLFNSSVLPKIFSQTGSHLLPQAFPEGSPVHPSYGSGHATVAGACVTILKAFFDERKVFPAPVQINPADGGQTTIPYHGPRLTVGGELNKLASNIATGRNIAGVHWRTDAVEAMKLGEAVAISMLRDMRATYKEPFSGFSLTKFDGTTISV